MLKHRININEVKDDSVELNVNDINIIDIVDKANLLNSTKTIVCAFDNNDRFNNINEIYGLSHYVIAIDNKEDNTECIERDYSGTYNIQGTINNLNGTFSFEVPYLYSLDISDIRHSKEEKEYLYFYFLNPHYFTVVKPELRGEYVNNDELYLWVYDNEGVENIFYLIGTIEDFSDNELLKNLGKIELLTDSSFRMEVTDNYSDIEEYYVGMKFYRINFLFSDLGQNRFLFYDYRCRIDVPLSTAQQINLLKENTLNEYIKDAKERSINKIVDMEKDIYYPVIFKGDNKYESVYKLKFNFHFIMRNNDNWTAETGNMWNGVKIDENEKFWLYDQNYINEYEKANSDKKPFFSYKNKDCQSDLLSLLRFTDNDVRYQKNKLKKSFIRLSFYDSPNMGNQNMLAYSTIFLNGGEYFNKYIKYIETDNYYNIKCKLIEREVDETNTNKNEEEKLWNENDFVISDGLTGIRVDREVSDKLKNNEELKSDTEIEEYRLSSQITVSDKYNSDASSEGFYLYLWRDLLPILDEEKLKKGTQTIYLKIEFNHAGYGRVIPFMMPYWDRDKWNGKTKNGIYYPKKEGIKQFENIIEDWNNENDTDGQYGAKQYMKFSYIKLKIGYDESQRKYIYYLDNDTYGIVPSIEENILTLNLYEAKMV